MRKKKRLAQINFYIDVLNLNYSRGNIEFEFRLKNPDGAKKKLRHTTGPKLRLWTVRATQVCKLAFHY